MTLTVLNVAYPFAPVGVNAVGGAEQVLTALDEALVRAGHRSIVVACEQSRTRGQLVASVRCHEVLSGDLCDFVRAEHRRAIEHALRRWPVDLIHFHGVDFHGYLPPTHVPVLVTLHLPLSFYPSEALRKLPANCHLQCVSASQARSWTGEPALLPVIENGVDIDGLSGAHARRDFALALGRICPEKGFHIAVDAARRAAIPLILAGEVFGYAAHGEYWLHELLPWLDRQHRWIGPADFVRKRRLLNSARCLLVPSLVAETSSLVAMEALACGTPVIAFPNGALADIVEDGRTGFLVRDEAAMADAIRRAHTIDPEACRAAARKRFSLRRSVSQYLGLYEKLVADHRASALEDCRVA